MHCLRSKFSMGGALVAAAFIAGMATLAASPDEVPDIRKKDAAVANVMAACGERLRGLAPEVLIRYVSW